jgi:membrane protein
MLWVSYAGLILLFGAEFTRKYSDVNGEAIEPSDAAEHMPQPAVNPMKA